MFAIFHGRVFIWWHLLDPDPLFPPLGPIRILSIPESKLKGLICLIRNLLSTDLPVKDNEKDYEKRRMHKVN